MDKPKLYRLYHNRDNFIIRIESVKSQTHNLSKYFNDIPSYHNEHFFYGTSRKELRELGNEIKQKWIIKAIRDLKAIQDLKVTTKY